MKKKWWNEKVAYQIYPRSFYDSNGDGIGDVRGIVEKLDYLQSLGVDLVWISPIYQSPMKDNGYDISDYYSIDPVFGTSGDMEELLVKAGERDIRILMDLVVNHCSSEHEWFQKALQNPKGEYGDYFIIREGRDGQAPNNWRSIFGGSVWELIEGTNLYYYHTFAKEQPDLNWENPRLRREIYSMMNWWLQKGLGGFRVDAITYIKKDPSYRSLPPDGADGLADLETVSSNYPGIEVFLREMRSKTFDVYDAFSVAEMSGVDAEKLEEYIGPDGLFCSIFDFSYMELDVDAFQWFRPRKVTAKRIKERLFESQQMAQEADSFLSVVLENHDQPRSLSKWFGEEEIGYLSATMLAVFNLTLRGIPFIYQGEEIGMSNTHFDDIHCYEDIMTWGQYERAKKEGISQEECLDMANRRSRDHARTPMQWEDSRNAGFSPSLPCFPVNENYRTVNVRAQEQGRSILNFYREMIRLRKSKALRDVMVYGTFEPELEEEENVIAYRRSFGSRTVCVMLNFVNREQKVAVPGIPGEVFISNYGGTKIYAPDYILRPFEAVLFGID